MSMPHKCDDKYIKPGHCLSQGRIDTSLVGEQVLGDAPHSEFSYLGASGDLEGEAMGEMWKVPRQESYTRRCTWCGLIGSNNRWQPERRQSPVKYTHGICPVCRKAFFPIAKESPLKHQQADAKNRRAWQGAGTPWGMARIAASLVVLLATRWLKLHG